MDKERVLHEVNKAVHDATLDVTYKVRTKHELNIVERYKSQLLGELHRKRYDKAVIDAVKEAMTSLDAEAYRNITANLLH